MRWLLIYKEKHFKQHKKIHEIVFCETLYDALQYFEENRSEYKLLQIRNLDGEALRNPWNNSSYFDGEWGKVEYIHNMKGIGKRK